MSLSRADQEFLELDDHEEDDDGHAPTSDKSANGRPAITADPTDITGPVDECIDVLNKPYLDVFQRDGMVVTVKSSNTTLLDSL